MPKDFAFDPITRDIIIDAAGTPVLTDNASTMMLHQMVCRYRECWQDPQLGSLLWDLKRFQAKPEVLAPAEAKRALTVLVARGRIGQLTVEAAGTTKEGRLLIATSCRDTSTGQVIDQKVKAG